MTRVTFLINEKAVKDFIDNGLIAYFPDDVYSDNQPHLRTCYAHIGQHSSCHVDYAKECREATPEEYKDLLAELISIGYDDLEITNKAPEDKVRVIETIDCTPTWAAMLTRMLAVRDSLKEQAFKIGSHSSDQSESLKYIDSELERMATYADRYTEMIKKQNQN
jgi:hypothetical protein